METPDIRSTSYTAAATTATANMMAAFPTYTAHATFNGQPLAEIGFGNTRKVAIDYMDALERASYDLANGKIGRDIGALQMATETTRLVKVFIVDPDTKIPVDKRLLYSGPEAMTDLNDQELFFELDIKNLLARHNEYRLTVEDKKANKEKPVYLEAIRVKDLRMQVVVLATF